ncbi:hypothetical protein PCANC_20412 [Puccinia coronata f. sp. avenae]|uniref:Uncharacterized protein n=1 Tax=Puccinia coronata f. sp. avenae TaxID=200324 RepID=A0A2N5SN02_9BASI|nr:hypothetical protein PCANC_20412 [Puccinia coronata f. sp. avenae]
MSSSSIEPVTPEPACLPAATNKPPPSPAANEPRCSLTSTKTLTQPYRSHCNSTKTISPPSSPSLACSPLPPSPIGASPAPSSDNLLALSPVNPLAMSSVNSQATDPLPAPSSTSAPPLEPMQEALDKPSDNFPIAQIFTDSFDIATIGSITIVDDTIESPELQPAPEDADEALQWDKECQEYYNYFQEELQQANADETEIKKKKKKKKKKKASNPTVTPDNPVLFYV